MLTVINADEEAEAFLAVRSQAETGTLEKKLTAPALYLERPVD